MGNAPHPRHHCLILVQRMFLRSALHHLVVGRAHLPVELVSRTRPQLRLIDADCSGIRHIHLGAGGHQREKNRESNRLVMGSR